MRGSIPRPMFEGARAGYVFKTDALGTGYYWDDGVVSGPEASPAGVVNAARSKTVLQLELLIMPPATGQ
eukprot:2977605-Karenia_brevis.AAC.1